MRMICLSLCLCFLMLLCGCSNVSTTQSTTATTQLSTVYPQDTVIDTRYFSLIIPQDWGADYAYYVSPPEGDTYALRFYEVKSHEEYGGHLFSIQLAPETLDYTQYPSYSVLGSIKTPQNTAFNLVVTYPTDVQFSPENAERYMAMEKDIPDILNSISYHDCTYSTESIPIKPSMETFT